MIDFRPCKHHGVCINCGKQQTENVPIHEIRTSSTGQDWSTLMLCEECLEQLRQKLKEHEQNKTLRNYRKFLIAKPPKPDGRYIIWTDRDVLEDYNLASIIDENWGACLGKTMREIQDYALELNTISIDDEINNLNSILKKDDPAKTIDILIFAKLDLWNRTRYSAKIIKDTDMSELFKYLNYETHIIYGDQKNILQDAYHHDGCNTYTFRKIKPEHIADVDDIISSLNDQKLCQEFIEKYTESLWPIAAETYGWN